LSIVYHNDKMSGSGEWKREKQRKLLNENMLIGFDNKWIMLVIGTYWGLKRAW
jgi:hypothetical protein